MVFLLDFGSKVVRDRQVRGVRVLRLLQLVDLGRQVWRDVDEVARRLQLRGFAQRLLEDLIIRNNLRSVVVVLPPELIDPVKHVAVVMTVLRQSVMDKNRV